MKEAFSYMFKDPCFGKKYLSYFCIAIFVSFLGGYPSYCEIVGTVPSTKSIILMGLMSLFIYLVIAGYGISIVKSIFCQKENIVLPNINIFRNLFVGLKLTLSGLLLFLLCFVIMFIPGFICGFIGAMYHNPQVFGLILTLIFIALTLFVLYIGFALSCIFAKTEKIDSLLKWGKAIELIKDSGSRYFCNVMIVVGLCGAVATISSILGFILIKSMFGLIIYALVINVVSSYTAFVSTYLQAKSINHELIEE